MKRILLSLLIAAFLPLLSAELPPSWAKWLSLDFENGEFFSPEKSAERGRIGDSTWRNLREPGRIVKADNAHGQALQVERGEVGGYAALMCGVKPIPDGCDFTVACDLNLGQGGSIYFSVYGAKSIGGLMPTGGGMLKVQHNGAWKLTDILLPTAWFHAEMRFRPAQGVYDVRVTLPDGTVQTVADNGMANIEPPKVIHAGNIPPVGNKGCVDNVLVTYNRLTSTEGREDVAHAKDAAVVITAGDNKPVTLPYTFAEGACDVFFSVDLKQLADIGSIAFFGTGDLRGRATGTNAGGQRVQLATPIKFVKTDRGIQADFDHSIYDKLKMSVTGEPGMVLEGFAIYRHQVGRNLQDKAFAEAVEGDFELPVYEGDDPAELHLFNRTEAPIEVKISLVERGSGKVVREAEAQTLQPGKNVIVVPLAGLPAGEYFAVVVEQTANGDGGQLKRLLRRQQIVETPAAEVTPFTGEKMYFPDMHYLEKADGVTFRQGTAEAFQVSRSKMTPDAVMQHGETIYLHDGKVCIGFFTTDGGMRDVTRKRYLATADPADLTKWDIQPVPKDFRHPEEPSNVMHKNRTRHIDNAAKPDAQGNIVYRYYDPAVDGPVTLTQVEFKYIPMARPGTMGYQPPPKVEGRELPQRTTWVVWHKEPGLSIILDRKPFLADGYPGDFEEGKESNDNFVTCGQFYSDDGKTLFYTRGCLLRRYPPFQIPYENFVNFGRFLTVFSTTDGFHFKRARISLPEKGDPIGTQHYGGSFYLLPRGNGLRIGYIMRYFIDRQCYGVDLNYTYDGLCWKRFPGRDIFVDNGPQGSWNAGTMHLSRFAVNVDGKTVHLVNWCSSGYHFYPGMDTEDTRAKMTAEEARRRYEPRKIEQWPLFKGYEALAEDIRNSRINVGIMVMRQDGFFRAEAADVPAEIVTKKITATGKLGINIQIADGGQAEIALLGADGNPLAGFTKTLGPMDAIDAPVFDTLPQGPFKVKLILKKAKLYTLNFN